jgi:4-amino-4-deoxy-L-arabinose transferase-like glycosyltransferase
MAFRVSPPEARFLAGPAIDLKLSFRSALGIALFGVALLLTNLGVGRVLTYHEAVFAEPAREMLATGNWAVPMLGGVPFTDKPPATAWCIALCMKVLGSQSEWAVRLPSGLAAIMTALLVALLAARWFGNRIGTIAGLVQLTTVHVLTQGKLGEADTLLAATVAAAMSAFAVANVDSPRGRSSARWLPWAFYAAAGCAFLVKAMVGPVFIFSACLAFVLLQRDLRALKFLLNPIGLLIFGLLVVPWLVRAYMVYPGIIDNMLLHNVGRFQGALGKNQPPYAYFYLIPFSVLPWTPFLLMALWRGLRNGEYTSPLWRFCACWFFPGMAILSVSAFKSRHYPIPLMSPLAILSAAGLTQHLIRRYSSSRAWEVSLAAATFLGGGTAVALVELRHVPNAHVIAALIAVASAGLLAVLYYEYRRQMSKELGAMFATVLAVAVGVQTFIMPRHDSYLHQTEMAQRINEKVPAGQKLYVLHLPENQIFYYLQSPVVRLDDEREFAELAATEPTPRIYVLAPKYLAEQMVAAGKAEILDRATKINSYMTERDRLTLVACDRPAAQAAQQGGEIRR